jgi:hypothetical protein
LRFFGLFQQKEYCRASHSPHSDSLDAKLGHIVGVGDMVEQRITLSRAVPLFDSQYSDTLGTLEIVSLFGFVLQEMFDVIFVKGYYLCVR